MDAWRLKMEPCMVCWIVVVDSHYLEEELDRDPHLSEKLYPDPH